MGFPYTHSGADIDMATIEYYVHMHFIRQHKTMSRRCTSVGRKVWRTGLVCGAWLVAAAM